ncbi:MAG TPA: Glu-tRNA(Gln) amidotransferase subunit GatE, partial [Candidatus Woesearchaeota archaeon]|nr:Glu-tRNA(Gln) amidotransferase subunit GatE [Candidatus Woesearchaeota archaeon]
MSEEMPYEEIGFKCGLEIHQQLACGKLFCSCQQDESDSNACSFFRLLSVSKSETGEEDLAASFEKAKSKSFQYVAPEDSSCLVECDEEPPHNVNDDAVKAALEAALLFGMRPLDCIQFMRKIVVDGSNTSGFQRTALIARGGRAEGSFGKIGVSTLCLEEDSCRIESREHHGDVYNLSRLGIPLLEICTEPDITSPKQARECAEQIGLLVRSISAVKRGLGTIRQDINISVKGGSRVEIKGAQDLYLIEKLAEYEAERQLGLLRVKDMLGPVDISKLRLEIKDVSSALNGSESKVIRAALEKKGKVLGTKLAGMKGILGIEIAPGKRVGSEISDYAKAAAGVKGLFHADELPAYGITGEECKKVSGLLGCSEQDSFVIIADDEIRAAKALEVGFCRALMLFESVPEEVRQARPDGSSSFMRPMPGSARMYPETDVPYIITDLSDIFRPKPITEKISEAVALGIEQQAAKELLKKGLYDA